MRRGPARARELSKPFLFIALRCDRPVEPGARFCLDNSATVTIGRAPAVSAVREGSELHIGIPDPSMSATHVRLTSMLGAWMAEDLGSKNGTLLDGRSISREQLVDGAIIEAGDTFLLFRTALVAGEGDLLVEAVRLATVPAGFATLSPVWAAELSRVRNVASSRVTILLRGATGTGKEVLASAIHQISGRAGPFQPVNCAAIPAGLVESVLFGHRRGAFSGAVDDQPGVIRGADRGTLLLDEIGDLPLSAQAALLRVLQEGEVVPVGGARASKLDLRVIAATHRNLEEMVDSGLFRADLLARLSGYVCMIPLLRERLEDFSLLVSSLLSQIGASKTEFTAEVARALLRYPWPLNIRELEKALSSAVALSVGDVIDLEHLPESIRAIPVNLRHDPAKLLRDELIRQLRAHGGNISAVARAMGKARTQIQRWIRRFDLDPLSFHR